MANLQKNRLLPSVYVRTGLSTLSLDDLAITVSDNLDEVQKALEGFEAFPVGFVVMTSENEKPNVGYGEWEAVSQTALPVFLWKRVK